jgi:hypothetical protein
LFPKDVPHAIVRAALAKIIANDILDEEETCQ